MKNSADTASEATPAPEAVGRSGKKKKLLMLVAIALMGVAAAGGYQVLGGGSEGSAQPEEGEVLALEAITINLTDGHYLKVRLSLQVTATVEHEPEGSKALDLAIEQFSEYSMGELASGEGRQTAKAELRASLEEAYHGDVMDVYFTEFVMQ